MDKRVVIIVIIVLILSFILFFGGFLSSNEGNVECRADSDCVPASTCHPDSCVPLGQAPDTSNVICTQECRPGTLDCGQGSCLCVNNKCGTSLR